MKFGPSNDKENINKKTFRFKRLPAATTRKMKFRFGNKEPITSEERRILALQNIQNRRKAASMNTNTNTNVNYVKPAQPSIAEKVNSVAFPNQMTNTSMILSEPEPDPVISVKERLPFLSSSSASLKPDPSQNVCAMEQDGCQGNDDLLEFYTNSKNIFKLDYVKFDKLLNEIIIKLDKDENIFDKVLQIIKVWDKKLQEINSQQTSSDIFKLEPNLFRRDSSESDVKPTTVRMGAELDEFKKSFLNSKKGVSYTKVVLDKLNALQNIIKRLIQDDKVYTIDIFQQILDECIKKGYNREQLCGKISMEANEDNVTRETMGILSILQELVEIVHDFGNDIPESKEISKSLLALRLKNLRFPDNIVRSVLDKKFRALTEKEFKTFTLDLLKEHIPDAMLITVDASVSGTNINIGTSLDDATGIAQAVVMPFQRDTLLIADCSSINKFSQADFRINGNMYANVELFIIDPGKSGLGPVVFHGNEDLAGQAIYGTMPLKSVNYPTTQFGNIVEIFPGDDCKIIIKKNVSTNIITVQFMIGDTEAYSLPGTITAQSFSVNSVRDRCIKYFNANKQKILLQRDSLKDHLLNKGKMPTNINHLLIYQMLSLLKSRGDMAYAHGRVILRNLNPQTPVNLFGSDYAGCYWPAYQYDYNCSTSLYMTPILNGTVNIVTGFDNILAVNALIYFDSNTSELQFDPNMDIPEWILYAVENPPIQNTFSEKGKFTGLFRSLKSLRDKLEKMRNKNLSKGGRQIFIGFIDFLNLIMVYFGKQELGKNNFNDEEYAQVIEKIRLLFYNRKQNLDKFISFANTQLGLNSQGLFALLQIYISEKEFNLNYHVKRKSITIDQAIASLNKNQVECLRKPDNDTLPGTSIIHINDVRSRCRLLLTEANKKGLIDIYRMTGTIVSDNQMNVSSSESESESESDSVSDSVLRLGNQKSVQSVSTVPKSLDDAEKVFNEIIQGYPKFQGFDKFQSMRDEFIINYRRINNIEKQKQIVSLKNYLERNFKSGGFKKPTKYWRLRTKRSAKDRKRLGQKNMSRKNKMLLRRH